MKRLSQTNCDKFVSGALNVTSTICSQTCKALRTPRFVLLDEIEAFNGVETNLKMTRIMEVEVLLKLRRIYYHVYECVKIINFIYGLPILIHIVRSATGLISELYDVGILFGVHTETICTLSVIIWTIILLGPIIFLTVICDISASKTKEIGHKLQALLLDEKVSSDMMEQLKLFCQQMSNDRIVFTAAGLFDVDLSFLCKFLTSVTTYIVVLIQLKLH